MNMEKTNGLTRKYIDEANAELEELAALNNELDKVKGEISIKLVTQLLQEMKEKNAEVLDNELKREYFDAGLGDKLSGAIKEAITTISKQKSPTISVSPTPINIDLSPLQKLISDNAQINKSLIEALGKSGTDNSLIQSVTQMIAKQNSLLEKVISPNDNSQILKSISEGLNKKEKDCSYEITVVRDNFSQLIKTATIKPINNG